MIKKMSFFIQRSDKCMIILIRNVLFKKFVLIITSGKNTNIIKQIILEGVNGVN